MVDAFLSDGAFSSFGFGGPSRMRRTETALVAWEKASKAKHLMAHGMLKEHAERTCFPKLQKHVSAGHYHASVVPLHFILCCVAYQ